ncbi:MAG: hypothetical protein AAF902_26455 [Chloroflexota bacterium]
MTSLEKNALYEALSTAGRRPDISLLKNIVDSSKIYKRPLLDLFGRVLSENLSSLDSSDPMRQVGIITGRLLIQMKAVEAIPLIGELYRTTWSDDVTVDGLDRDPAAFGTVSIPVFSSIAKMNTLNKWHNGKAVSITILTDIALVNNEARSEIQHVLRDLLPPLTSRGGISAPKDEMWGDIAVALGKLRDEASYKTIIAMMRQGIIDSSKLSRNRYEKFYLGKQKPRQPEPFDIFKKYESVGNFEDMMNSMLNAPETQGPDSSQDFVSKARQIESKKNRKKKGKGRP